MIMKTLLVAVSTTCLCGCVQTSRFEKKNDTPWKGYETETHPLDRPIPKPNNYYQSNSEYQRIIIARRQEEAKANAAAAQKAAAASGKQ